MAATQRERQDSKKQKILAAYQQGTHDILQLPELAGSQTSYVASILRDAGLLEGYFDLYTQSSALMNIYSPIFAKKLLFRNSEALKVVLNF